MLQDKCEKGKILSRLHCLGLNEWYGLAGTRNDIHELKVHGTIFDIYGIKINDKELFLSHTLSTQHHKRYRSEYFHLLCIFKQ